MGAVRQAGTAEALSVLAGIPEFDPADPSGGTWEESARARLEGTRHLVLVADSAAGLPVGALIAYDRYHDGSLYCWLAGVAPEARRQGALAAMMEAMKAWASENGFTAIRIGTRNKFRGMLAYLVSDGYLFLEVEPPPGASPADYGLRLMKDLCSPPG